MNIPVREGRAPDPAEKRPWGVQPVCRFWSTLTSVLQSSYLFSGEEDPNRKKRSSLSPASCRGQPDYEQRLHSAHQFQSLSYSAAARSVEPEPNTRFVAP